MLYPESSIFICTRKSGYCSRLILLFCVLVSLAACGTVDGYRDGRSNPDERLNDLLILLEYESARGNQCLEIRRPASAINDCGRILVEVERIHNDFPYHQRTLMTLAVLYFQTQRNDRSQYVLDQLLSMPGAHAEAAVLRARIALAEGNIQLAVQVLMQQIMFDPGNAELRSALASIYYAQGDIQRARNVLNADGIIHPQPWVQRYHNALLAEAEQDWRRACQLYLESLVLNSDYMPSRSRIIALAAHISCQETALPIAAAPVSAVSVPVPVPAPIVQTPLMQTPQQSIPNQMIPHEPAPIVPTIEQPQPLSTPQAMTSPVVHTAGNIKALSAVVVEQINSDRVRVEVSTSGEIDDVLMVQLNNPPRVVVQFPGAINSLGHQGESFVEGLVESVNMYEADDALNLRFRMRQSANVEMVNEPGRVLLYFSTGNSGEVLP